MTNDCITKCHLGLQPLFVGTNQMNSLFKTMEVKSDTTLKGPRCTNSTRPTSDRCAATEQDQLVGVVIVASVPVDMVLDGPGDVLGFGSVSPLVTNFCIDPVMTRNPQATARFVLDLIVNYTMKLMY